MMCAALAYERLNEAMVAAIPDLEDDYRRELDWRGEEPPPSHAVFGEILNPYLSKRLAADDGDSLAMVFKFLERMAADVDPRVQDVLRDTVLEHIRDEPLDHRDRATRAMGPATLVHWRQVAAEP